MDPSPPQPPASKRYLVCFTIQELLINVAALMEHHSRRVLDFSETKAEKTLDERIVAASYIKTCESMVQRIQGAICQAEKLG